MHLTIRRQQPEARRAQQKKIRPAPLPELQKEEPLQRLPALQQKAEQHPALQQKEKQLPEQQQKAELLRQPAAPARHAPLQKQPPLLPVQLILLLLPAQHTIQEAQLLLPAQLIIQEQLLLPAQHTIQERIPLPAQLTIQEQLHRPAQLRLLP
jgi:hypothetical protein